MKKLSQAYRNIKEKAGQAVQGILASPRVVSLVNRTTKKSPFGKVDPAMLADQKPASLIHQISARASQLPVADSVTAEEALLDLEVSAELDHAIAMRELARLRTERARRGTHRTEVGVLRARGCLLISAACQSNPLARGCR